MKSFTEWKIEDPDWSRLKAVWGSGAKHVDPMIVNKLKLKIEGITDQYIKGLNNPNIKEFRDLPPNLRDSLAQSLVVATLKAFYSNFDSDASGSRTALNTQKLGQFQQEEPQNNMTAPANWRG